MVINGVRVVKNGSCHIFYVDSFTDELKNEIKDQLAGIYNGLSDTIQLPEVYNLNNTLKNFVEIYSSKSGKTKKGMIGELLAHVLLNAYFNDFTSLSVLKNKEERSIKKGFDILYFDELLGQIWYSEVKSGNPITTQPGSTQFNTTLLNRAKTGIVKIFDSKRPKLWDSALVDVLLTVGSRIDVRQLLAADSETVQSNDKRHVVLISALYNDLSDEVDLQSLLDFHDSVCSEDIFLDSIVISIQKRAYQTIADFLIHESTLV